METAPTADPSAAIPAAQQRVLVVDDVALNRRVAQRFLERFGCAVAEAEDVAGARVQIRAQEFDFVFTDVEMPEVNGFEAIRLFRDTDADAHPGRHSPLRIIVVSAGQIGTSHEDYLAAGFDDYLDKPILLERLRALLLKWKHEPTGTAI